MEDFADLGLSTFEYVIDKHHDRVYDGVTNLPTKLKKRRPSKHQKKTTVITTKHGDQDDVEVTEEDVYYQGRESDSWMTSRYGDDYRRSDGRARYGRDDDVYDPEQQGMRNFAGRDGYATPNGYNAANRGGAPAAYAPPDSYDMGTRYLDYPSGGYASGNRYKSYDDLRSRRDRDGYDDDEEDDDGYEGRNDRERGLQKRRDRDNSRASSRQARSRSQTRDKDRDSEHEDDNTQLKKWGATFAGAAIGAYGTRRMKGGKLEDTWVPAAVGAVIGGLVAREAEKMYYEKREQRKERQAQGGWRSRSR